MAWKNTAQYIWTILIVQSPTFLKGCQQFSSEWKCDGGDDLNCAGNSGQSLIRKQGNIYILDCKSSAADNKLFKCLVTLNNIGNIEVNKLIMEKCSFSQFLMKDFLSGQKPSQITLRSSKQLNLTISNINSLKLLQIEESWHSDTFEPILDNLPVFLSLTVRQHGFVNIPDDSFQRVINIKHISITSGTKLKILPEDTLFRLKNLENLNLQSNKIEEIKPLSFKDLTNLMTLDLSRNNIVQVPATLFSHLKYLKTLDLSSNQIEEIQESTFKNLNLYELHLSNNPRLSVLPKSSPFGQGSPLGQTVNISDCNLSEMPNIDWQQNTLRKIDLSGNNIRNPILPINTWQKTIINLDRNNIATINLDYNVTADESPVYSIVGNSPICDCTMEDFLMFLHSKLQMERGVFDDPSVRLKCRSPKSGQSLIEVCPPQRCLACNETLQNDFIFKAVFLSAVGVTLLGVGTCAAMKKDTVLAIFYDCCPSCLICIAFQVLEEKSHLYDAFICYHPDDGDIANDIITTLQPEDFQLAVLGRDKRHPGFRKGIQDNMIHSMLKSRKTILILSSTFVVSPLFKEEFQGALNQMPMGYSKSIIPIFVDDLKGVSVSPRQIIKLLSLQSPMKWGERFFWKRLRYYLRKLS